LTATEQVDVHVFDPHASRAQFPHVDPAVLVQAAPVATPSENRTITRPIRSPKKPSQARPKPALDMAPEELRHLDIALSNVDLHLGSMARAV